MASLGSRATWASWETRVNMDLLVLVEKMDQRGSKVKQDPLEM